jgi:predicted alpha/beta-hydrolase family hydrolase
VEASAGLVERGCSVVRFHFPYMQERVDAGRSRPPDRAPVLLDAWRAMLDEALGWPGRGPLVLSGKSLGGRMASLLLAAGRAPEAVAAVYLGYPLHPAGRPERPRVEHLPAVTVPQLFVSGTRDALATFALLEQALRSCRSAELLVVPGGDHSLAVRQRDRQAPPAPPWLDGVAAFVHRHARVPRA